jgi:ribA/ribD-fused uncharacterized protein
MKTVFNKVKEEFGWLGNMAPYSINYENQIWKTSEALFQAMRFNNPEIRELIRKEKSPMGAKMKAKSHQKFRVVEPMSDEDVENMKKCVRLKFEQNPEIRIMLLGTGDSEIIEDIGNRNGERHKFWGAKRVNENQFDGINMMGEILMELRNEIQNNN